LFELSKWFYLIGVAVRMQLERHCIFIASACQYHNKIFPYDIELHGVHFLLAL